MLFNSTSFVLFLAAAATLHWLIPARARPTFLLVCSLGFYALFDVWHTTLLVGCSAVAFVFARRIAKADDERAKKGSAVAAVVLLLGALAAFKYLSTVLGRLGVGGSLASLAIPVGISYYTFKLISYVVDVYWGEVEARREPWSVLRYAAFFPQILSGPIQRSADFFERETQTRSPDPALFVAGFRLMLFGYFKKLVIADRAAIFVDQVFATPREYPSYALWTAAYLFAIQLYADFSGLSDIAIGASCFFGIRSPKNFESPFYAPNIQDFWRRWHMTLTSWLGRYVFTPIHMALRDWGQAGLVVAIAVNMLAIGAWHGPRATYVAFGAVCAIYMAVSALTLRARNKWFSKRPVLARVRRVVGPIVTFHMMVVAFIAFRASSIADALHVLRGFATGFATAPSAILHRAASWGPLDGWSVQHVVVLGTGLVVMEGGHRLQAKNEWLEGLEARPRILRWGLYYALMLAILLFARLDSQTFIYFKF
jgi:hypothetical protein